VHRADLTDEAYF